MSGVGAGLWKMNRVGVCLFGDSDSSGTKIEQKSIYHLAISYNVYVV